MELICLCLSASLVLSRIGRATSDWLVRSRSIYLVIFVAGLQSLAGIGSRTVRGIVEELNPDLHEKKVNYAVQTCYSDHRDYPEWLLWDTIWGTREDNFSSAPDREMAISESEQGQKAPRSRDSVSCREREDACLQDYDDWYH